MSPEYLSPAKIEEASIKVKQGGNKKNDTMRIDGTKSAFQNLFKLILN